MTSTISIPIASPSDDQKFLDPLPNEIIQTIVSYLTRSDCMQYMRVCRSWYDTVPQYFKEHWSSLKLLRHDVYSSNNLWLRCIDGGSHIKQVAFEWFHKQHEIDRIMKLLFVKDCQNIEALEFYRCSVRDNTGLLLLLQHQQLSHLTELKLTHHFANVPFLLLLKACPKLTHFTFTSSETAYSNNVYDQEPDMNATTLPPSLPSLTTKLAPQLPDVHQYHSISFPQLTYLNLDVILDKHLRLEPVLRKCPNLRYFLYLNENIEKHPRYIATYHTNIVHLDDLLLKWCKKLVFLQINSPPSSSLSQIAHPNPWGWQPDYLQFEDIVINSNKKTPLDDENNKETKDTGIVRYLLISEAQGFGPSQVTPHFIRNHNTLEYLFIGCGERQRFRNNLMVNWSSMFIRCNREKIIFPHLHTLIFDGILFENVPFLAILRQCPTLEHLTVKTLNLPLNLLQIFQHGLIQLKQLHLHTVKLIQPLEDQQQPRRINANQSPLYRQFVNLNTRGCLIERIRLYEVQNLSNTMLQGIAQLSTLRHLDITFYYPYRRGTSSSNNNITYTISNNNDDSNDEEEEDNDEMYQFAEKLSATKIETLTLARVASISYKTLVAFGHLCHLKSLNISRVDRYDKLHIHGPGLVQMMNKTQSLQDVLLKNVVLTDFGVYGKNNDTAIEFLDQEIHQYKVMKKPSGSKRVKLNNIIIMPLESTLS